MASHRGGVHQRVQLEEGHADALSPLCALQLRFGPVAREPAVAEVRAVARAARVGEQLDVRRVGSLLLVEQCAPVPLH